MSAQVVLTINGKEVQMPVEKAREIYEELRAMFGETAPVVKEIHHHHAGAPVIVNPHPIYINPPPQWGPPIITC